MSNYLVDLRCGCGANLHLSTTSLDGRPGAIVARFQDAHPCGCDDSPACICHRFAANSVDVRHKLDVSWQCPVHGRKWGVI